MKQRYGWGLVVILALSVACSGKKRAFGDGVEGDSVDMGGAGGSGMTAEAAPQPAAAGGTSEALPDPDLLGSSEPTNSVPAGSLGAACTSSSQCNAPGLCVDGVCCSSACTELCAACNVPGSVGTCSAAPSDAACGELTCAGVDTECRKLDTSQLALNCEAFGACKVNAECAATNEPATTACQAGTGTCDGAGACVVAAKASLGETCSADTDCAEGHCVAGDDGARICCDAACDSPCQACSAAGHCDATPASDARCEAVACPADDVCRDYTADVTASQCRSFAQCQTARDCPFVALRPDAECECDAVSGACRLRPGAACAEADQCDSGVCAANAEGTRVCCSNACGEGLFCSSDGATCVACEGDAISCEGDVELRCNAGAIARVECRNGCTPGSGCNSLPPLGFLCDAGQCAAPNVCQRDVAGASRCCSRDCAAEGKICAENGSCVCEEGQVASGNNCLLQDGDPCTSSQQCQAGSTCTDGVCCQQACNGTCERCEPNTGLCVAITAGQTDNTCNNGRQCSGARGDCRLNVRQPCNGNGAECSTNNCEPTVGNATQICCSQACSVNRPFCRSDGNGCVECETNADCGNGCNAATGLCNALRPIGAACGVSSQCANGGLCLNDEDNQARCCERNCAEDGLVCNTQGRCVVPLRADGEQCSTAADCASNVCTEWLPDLDGDGVGSTASVSGQPSSFICGNGSAANRPPPLTVFQGNLPCFGGGSREWQYVPARAINDCCDHPCPGVATGTVSSALVFPGAVTGGTAEANCAPGVFTLDYNCNGQVEVVGQIAPPFPPACNAMPNAISNTDCGARSGFTKPHTCGIPNSRQICGLSGGVCSFIASDSNPVTPTCR